MILSAIAIIFLIAMACAGLNGEWGSVAVGAVIVIILAMVVAGERKNTRAWWNCREYWANGGPERYTRDVVNNIRCEQTVNVTGSDAPKCVEHKENATHTWSIPSDTYRNVSRETWHVCHHCGRMVQAAGVRVATGSGVMIEYTCPKCGNTNLTQLGA